MDTKTSFDKGRYQAPLCTVIALHSDSCVMQASIVTLSIIELSNTNPITTEQFDVTSENDLLF